MRKKEHIHIHALFGEVTRYLLENEDVPPETLSTYETLDTRPSSIHKSKQKHKEATTALNSAIEPWLEQRDTEAPMISMTESS